MCEEGRCCWLRDGRQGGEPKNVALAGLPPSLPANIGDFHLCLRYETLKFSVWLIRTVLTSQWRNDQWVYERSVERIRKFLLELASTASDPPGRDDRPRQLRAFCRGAALADVAAGVKGQASPPASDRDKVQRKVGGESGSIPELAGTCRPMWHLNRAEKWN